MSGHVFNESELEQAALVWLEAIGWRIAHGGEFYTPRCVVKLLVEMLEPFRGRVYDPCCGSAGMFVQSVEFIRAHASGNGNSSRSRADMQIIRPRATGYD